MVLRPGHAGEGVPANVDILDEERGDGLEALPHRVLHCQRVQVTQQQRYNIVKDHSHKLTHTKLL